MSRSPVTGSGAPDRGPVPASTFRTGSWRRDALAVLWLLGGAVAMLGPAFVHGHFLGPFDLMSLAGLTRHAGVTAHQIQNLNGGDLINELIPWSTLAWSQVHSGHLPLWNPYNGMGIPLAFNWQSAPFSLPAVVGYLAPVRYAYTVSLLATLFIAGTGVYVLARILGLSRVACVFAGTAFELSGPVTGWLGYPHASVASWGGWILAALCLVFRGRHRVRSVAFLGIVCALAVYSGQPETLTAMGLAMAVFVAVQLALRLRVFGGTGPVLRPLADVVLGTVAGAALSAPLALPALQLTGESVRSVSAGSQGVPLHELVYLIFQGFDGLPIAGNIPFGGYTLFYSEVAAFVGVIAVSLAVVGVVVRRRSPEIVGMTAVALVAGLLIYSPVASLMNDLPLLQKVNWLRALLSLALAIAVLAGAGLDSLVRSYSEAAVRRWTTASLAAAGVVVAGLWLFGRGSLPPAEASIRARSFIEPVIEVGVGLAVVGVLAVVSRRREALPIWAASFGGALRRGGGLRNSCYPAVILDEGGHGSKGASRAVNPAPSGANGPVAQATEGRSRSGMAGRARALGIGVGTCAGLSLLVCETVVLILASSQLISSSSQFFQPTPAVSSLQRAVGTQTVAAGRGYCSLGIAPEGNIAFRVHELDVYDPILPKSYYQSWLALTGTRMPAGFNLFCADITSAQLARRFGASFVLEPKGAPGPVGGVFDRAVGDEILYRIPDSGEATLTRLTSEGSLPSDDTQGTVLPVRHPSPSSWRIATSASTASVLRLRLSNVPGWHATIDGHPLALAPFSGSMLQARVPAGRHIVEVRYWPGTFTLGLVIAALAAVGLSTALLLRRRRPGKKTRARPAPEPRVAK
jgi:hypothetical protein